MEDIRTKYLSFTATPEGDELFIRIIPKNDEKTPQDGISSLERQLKDRIERVYQNVTHFGSLKKLIAAGGEPTKNFLDRTVKMLVLFMFLSETRWVSITKEDFSRAWEAARMTPEERNKLLKSPWKQTEKKADELREGFFKSLKRVGP